MVAALEVRGQKKERLFSLFFLHSRQSSAFTYLWRSRRATSASLHWLWRFLPPPRHSSAASPRRHLELSSCLLLAPVQRLEWPCRDQLLTHSQWAPLGPPLPPPYALALPMAATVAACQSGAALLRHRPAPPLRDSAPCRTPSSLPPPRMPTPPLFPARMRARTRERRRWAVGCAPRGRASRRAGWEGRGGPWADGCAPRFRNLPPRTVTNAPTHPNL